MKRMFLKNYKSFSGLVLVVVLLISCEEILLEYDITNEEIGLIAPFDEALLNPSDISFRWEAVNGATQYEFQIAKPDFDQPEQIVVSEFLDENFFHVSLPEGIYQWRVRAFNSGYTTDYNRKSFQVENNQDFSSRRVNLLMPSDNLVTNQYVQEFRWDTIGEATLYRFQLLKDDVLMEEQVTSGNDFNYNLPNGVLTWQVRAENDTQNTFYSERKIVVDTIAPPKAELLKPEDNATFSNNTINFEWEISGDSTQGLTQEIDSIYIYKDLELEDLVKKSQGVNNSFSDILDRNETYYWYIISFDEAGNIGDKSDVFSFKIN